MGSPIWPDWPPLYWWKMNEEHGPDPGTKNETAPAEQGPGRRSEDRAGLEDRHRRSSAIRTRCQNAGSIADGADGRRDPGDRDGTDQG